MPSFRRLLRPLPLLALPVALAVGRQGPTVTVKDLQYAPQSVSVGAGGVVTWTNADTRDYTVTAEDGSFDSGPLRPGRSFRHTFPAAGEVPYGSTIHPRMKGMVVVTD